MLTNSISIMQTILFLPNFNFYFIALQIFGMRVLERFRGIDGSTIQGVERIYIYGSETLDSSSSKPIAVVKSNFSMKKIE